jgi:hypothetical protein
LLGDAAAQVVELAVELANLLVVIFFLGCSRSCSLESGGGDRAV